MSGLPFPSQSALSPLTAPLLAAKPRALVPPESPAEHARNCLQWLADVELNPDGTYTLTALQMAGLAFRLNRIAFGEQVEALRARAVP